MVQCFTNALQGYRKTKSTYRFLCCKFLIISGGSYWVRTSDPPDVNRDAVNQLS